MERKLASIQQISELRPIEGADKIEVALMEGLGWECVVKKGEVNLGDYVVYFEIDSVLPERKEFEFLRDKKFRIRTIKLKGQVSQGLIMPLSILRESPSAALNFVPHVGKDVTEMLGVTKYLSPSEREEEEREARLTLNKSKGLKKFLMRYKWFRDMVLPKRQGGDFPSWISKTDEERLQNMPKVLTDYKDRKVYITEKIDYQSATFTGRMVPKYNGLLGKLLKASKYEFIVCSRNRRVTDPNSLYMKVADKYKIKEILEKYPNLTIQGEQGDTKVQGNKYKIKEPSFWVFNIIDHVKRYHYDYDEMRMFCHEANLPLVPLDDIGSTLSDIGNTVQHFVEYSKGKSVLADIPREGIVVRCIENGKKIFSFKVINPDFLLKYE